MNKFIIILIVLLIVGFGAWYLFFQKSGGEGEQALLDETNATGELSASNQVSILDQEINATDITNLDKELSSVETELEAALQE